MVQSAQPVVDVELLSDLAARLCNPEDPKAASVQIENQAAKMRQWLSALNWFRWFAISIAALIFLASVNSFLLGSSKDISLTLFSLALMILSMIFVIIGLSALRLIQRRKKFFVTRPYDAKILPLAEKLLLDLAKGVRKAVLINECGLGSPEAIRTRDGKLMEMQLSSGIFLNRHAPLLLSTNQSGWLLVYLSIRDALTKPVYVIVEEQVFEETSDVSAPFIVVGAQILAEQKPSEASPDIVDAREEALQNNNQKHQWLVGGTLDQFKANWERFAVNVLPHQQGRYEIALTVGRAELRKGGHRGSQAAAIKRIKEALVAAKFDPPGINGGDAKHWLKKVLQGKYDKWDIKGYFSDQ